MPASAAGDIVEEQEGEALSDAAMVKVPALGSAMYLAWHVAGFMLRWLLSNLPDNHKWALMAK